MTPYDILIKMLPFLMLPVGFAIVRAMFNVLLAMMKGTAGERATGKELIKEPEKINIDKDLQKYFNYEE